MPRQSLKVVTNPKPKPGSAGVRLAFSTLGVPGASLADIVYLAVTHGYAGVELRCAEDEPVHDQLTDIQRAKAAMTLRRAGVRPVGLASYIQVATPGPDGPILAALRRHIWLAADLGARYLRVFPGGQARAWQEADRCAIRRLRAVADLALACGVQILLETHDSHRSAADVARVLSRVGTPAIGALWDTLHTHLAGDHPHRAAGLLLPHLGYVQLKDAAAPDDLTPLPLGQGTLPLDEVVDALAFRGYRGWLVWEYEARWHPKAQPLPPLLARGRAFMEDALAGQPDFEERVLARR